MPPQADYLSLPGSTHRLDDLALQPLHGLVRSLADLLRAGSSDLSGGKRLIRSPLVLSELVKTLYVFVVPPQVKKPPLWVVSLWVVPLWVVPLWVVSLWVVPL